MFYILATYHTIHYTYLLPIHCLYTTYITRLQIDRHYLCTIYICATYILPHSTYAPLIQMHQLLYIPLYSRCNPLHLNPQHRGRRDTMNSLHTQPPPTGGWGIPWGEGGPRPWNVYNICIHIYIYKDDHGLDVIHISTYVHELYMCVQIHMQLCTGTGKTNMLVQMQNIPCQLPLRKIPSIWYQITGSTNSSETKHCTNWNRSIQSHASVTPASALSHAVSTSNAAQASANRLITTCSPQHTVYLLFLSSSCPYPSSSPPPFPKNCPYHIKLIYSISHLSPTNIPPSNQSLSNLKT